MDLILRKSCWRVGPKAISKTWLSWNGKRVRLESVKHCKQIESMGSLDKSERQRSLHEEEQCERIERSPRSKTPSL